MDRPAELLPGTLDLLILKAVSLGPQHGLRRAAAHPAALRRPFRDRTGRALSGPLPPRASRLAAQRVGHFGEQPPRQVLPPYCRRPAPPARGDCGLGANGGGRRERPVVAPGGGVACWRAFVPPGGPSPAAQAGNRISKQNCGSISSAARRTSSAPASPAKKRPVRRASNSDATTPAGSAAAKRTACAGPTSLRQDLLYAFRTFRRNRGFTAVAVLTLALGIGATTAIFTVVNAVLFRPLPYAHPEQLVHVQKLLPSYGVNPFAGNREFVAWRNDTQTLRPIAAYTYSWFNLTGGGEPERVNSGFGYHLLLSAGRSASPRTPLSSRGGWPGGPPVVLLSEALWKRRYRGDPSIIGKGIILDSKTYTVVGVLPAKFVVPAGTPSSKPCGCRLPRA